MTYTVGQAWRLSQHVMTYAGAMVRIRDAGRTRDELLAAARRRFGSEGYERTTIRAIAADVGVDAALVSRYFGSKQELFAAIADFSLDLPDVTGVPPGELGSQAGRGFGHFPQPAGDPNPEPDTSYVCVADRHGNLFSATPSDGSYGSPVVPGTGLIPSKAARHRAGASGKDR